MADDKNTPPGGEGEGETITLTKAELAARLEEVAKPLKAKVDELLGETKAEKQKRREIEQAAEEAETQRQKEQGEFKALYEKTLADLEKERETASTYRGQVRERDIRAAASSVASELTRDTARAALLVKEASTFVELDEDGAASFKIGGVAVDQAKVVDHLRTQYPFLADGNQSNGGGATGGAGRAGTLKRSEMKPEEKAKYLNEHGQKAYLALPR